MRDSLHERRGPMTWGSGLSDKNTFIAIGTGVLILLTALTLHNAIVTGAITLVGIGYAILSFAAPDNRLKREVNKLARKIEKGPPGLRSKSSKPLPRDTSSRELLLNDLTARLEQKGWLCVIRLDGRDILGALPGTREDAIPESIACLRIVGAFGWKLDQVHGLDESEKKIAANDLRGVASDSLRANDPQSAKLLQTVASILREDDKLDGRLVPLIDARKDALDRFAGRWMLKLFEELHCKFGVFTQESEGPDTPHIRQRLTQREGLKYVTGILSPWLSKQQCDVIFASLCASAGRRQDLDPDLLKIRCAVIAAAAEFGEEAEATQRLLRSESSSFSTFDAKAREAALEVRWVIDRKVGPGVTGAFDRLSIIDTVTPEMLRVLLEDLGMDKNRAGELFDWLRGDEFRLAGIVASTEDAISLAGTVRAAALTWLGDVPQSVAYQKAQIARERCYRVCLVMNRARVPAGYEDWVAPGYAGLHLFETPDWWGDVYAWCGLVEGIASLEDRRDAGVAITCLFLETWWWWGDQLRLKFVDDVLGMARTILRDQPEWIGALEEFDQNYQPELNLRADAGDDRWQHVAHALAFLADNLGLRQGDVPAEPVPARIYVCWCFFSGDVAQQTGNLEAADKWFGEAAEACSNGEDNAAMRAFAHYQRADVWIPSDTERSMRLIMRTSLAEAAVELNDLSLRAYVARMYGDIRWKSGNIDGAFDAYGRALLLTYVYQVDQESEKMPPSEYTYALYREMRTRFLNRLGEAREYGRASEADAAVERIRTLFGPYWELKRPAASGKDPLADVVPPLPEKADFEFGSGYAQDALLMLQHKLTNRVAEPVERLLRDREEK
jgi:hypothetical protein